MKPIITYMIVAGGTIAQVMADNQHIGNIPVPKSGINSSWQENLLSDVRRVAEAKFGEANYILPYYIGQSDGYVYRDQEAWEYIESVREEAN